jgi:hypothetical protein
MEYLSVMNVVLCYPTFLMQTQQDKVAQLNNFA